MTNALSSVSRSTSPKERKAGRTFLIDHAALTQTGVDQQTNGEREIGVTREVLDGLRTTVFFQLEIVFAEIADHGAVLVANRSEQIDHLGVGRESGGVLGFCRGCLFGVELRFVLTLQLSDYEEQDRSDDGGMGTNF